MFVDCIVLTKVFNTDLTAIPGHIPIATTNLYFSNNLLNSLSKSNFQALPNLQYLDLSNNSIRDIEEVSCTMYLCSVTKLTPSRRC